MTFEAREVSRTLGEPVNLYFFRYGDTDEAFYAYTDAEQDIVHDFGDPFGPVTFVTYPVNHSEITSSGSLDKKTLDVGTPDDSEIAMLFRYHPPSQVVVLTIFQGHESDAEFLVAWSGRVLGCQLTDTDQAMFTCEPVSTSLKRAGLRRNYQYGCPHLLYGPQCKADKAAATITVGVGAVNGALVDLGPSWAATDMKVKYLGGMATWVRPDGRTEIRTIIQQADSATIILSGVALGLLSGSSIDLTLGCDHKWDSDCTHLHNNVKNFGGQPFIPTKNPIGIVNNFY